MSKVQPTCITNNENYEDRIYTDKYILRQKIAYPWKYNIDPNSKEFEDIIAQYNDICEKILTVENSDR